MTKSAVVTGAGRGIGRGIAAALVNDGWFVVGIDLNEKDLKALEEAHEGRVSVLVGDVAETATLEAALAAAQDMAPLAGWVNNAAFAPVGTLLDTTPEDLQRTLAVNLGGAFWGSAIAVRNFLERDVPGAIVNISSIQASFGFNSWAAYSTSKGAINQLTRYTAIEYGPKGIRANAVAPGTIRTPLHIQLVNETEDPDATTEFMRSNVPLDRIGEEGEIGDAVAFLLSDKASYISGQVIAVDGAWSVSAQPRSVTSIEGA